MNAPLTVRLNRSAAWHRVNVARSTQRHIGTACGSDVLSGQGRVAPGVVGCKGCLRKTPPAPVMPRPGVRHATLRGSAGAVS